MKWPRRASCIGFLVGVLVATLLGTGHLARTLWSTLQNQLSGAAAPVDLEPASLGAAVFAGTLEDPRLDEASGLAVSQRSRDLLWVVNDSGAEPVLHALGLDGSEVYSIEGLDDSLQPRQALTVRAVGEGGEKTFETLVRIDSPVEVDYYRNGGILHTVLRALLKE